MEKVTAAGEMLSFRAKSAWLMPSSLDAQ